MQRAWVAAVGLALACLASGAPALAQGRPRLAIVLPPAAQRGTEGPAVRAQNVVSDATMRDLLQSGFPARLHFRVELWSQGGLVDAMRRSTEWDVIVRLDALKGEYRVARRNGNEFVPVGQFVQLAEAVSVVEQAYVIPLLPDRSSDRQYYTATLEVETMSNNDLDEVERWLRGELQPAVRGDRNPGTALGRGLRTFFARLMGAERRNLRARSTTFVVPG